MTSRPCAAGDRTAGRTGRAGRAPDISTGPAADLVRAPRRSAETNDTLIRPIRMHDAAGGKMTHEYLAARNELLCGPDPSGDEVCRALDYISKLIGLS